MQKLKLIKAHAQRITLADLIKLEKGDVYWETSSGLGGSFRLKYLGQLTDRDTYHFKVQYAGDPEFNKLKYTFTTEQALEKLSHWHREQLIKNS